MNNAIGDGKEDVKLPYETELAVPLPTYLLVMVNGGKVVKGEKENTSMIFKPDTPGRYHLYQDNSFTNLITG